MAGETTQEAHSYRDGDTIQGQCKACKQQTTMRYRVEKALFGLKKSAYWVCTRCGNEQDSPGS